MQFAVIRKRNKKKRTIKLKVERSIYKGFPKTKYGRNWVKILTKNISWKIFAPGS